VQEKCAETQKMLAERQQVIFMIQHQQIHRVVFKLIGVDQELKQFPEEEDILATNNSVFRSYCYQKAYISFMFRSHDCAKENAEKFFACSDNSWANFLLFAHAAQSFYIGLMSFWLARTSGQQQQQWQERGSLLKSAVKRWAESSRWTFENKWYLLEAEESYCKNDFKAAKSFYEKAISSAKDHKVR
jgi:hypothetical protein